MNDAHTYSYIWLDRVSHWSDHDVVFYIYTMIIIIMLTSILQMHMFVKNWTTVYINCMAFVSKSLARQYSQKMTAAKFEINEYIKY